MTVLHSLSGLLVATGALLLFLCVHVLLWRAVRLKGKGFFMLVILAVISFSVACLFCLVFLRLPVRSHVVMSISFYLLLMMLYLHFYTGILRSVSIRILEELQRSPSRRLSLSQLDVVYSKQGMIEDRVVLLVKTGWLTEKDIRLTCTPSGSRMARLGIAVAKIYARTITG